MKSACYLILKEKNKFLDYFLNDEIESIGYLPMFNDINIIVGANNSGKSRFMRELMRFESFSCIDNKLFNEYNEKVIPTQLNFNANRLSFLDLKKEITNQISNNLNVLENYYGRDHVLTNDFKNDFLNLSFIISKFNKIYIPTLRSAHSLFEIAKSDSKSSNEINTYTKVENDIFLNTYLKNYKLDKNIDVFTGLHLYREILNSRNSEKSIRNQFEKFEKFLSLNFFDGKQIDIVAKFDKSDNEKGINESELILIHIDGDKETSKLYDLGDGIQALIVLMYKIFMSEPNSFIYIDEPELNLHPGMQRLFLEQICSNPDLIKKNLKFIISTHSNHFLDLTIEKDNVSIYSFSPKTNELNEKQFLIKNVNRGDNRLLKDLGVNNSSVFMANCSIWVEGISDRNYIKAFLKSYTDYLSKNDNKNFKNIKEDIDFAFFEYAGSNIDHYIFEKEIENEDADFVLKDIQALAISNRIFLLADSDASKLSSKKGKRLKALEDAKTENFIPKILWNLREIENLLANDVWKEILLNLCNKTLVKSNREEIEKRIEKALSEVNSSHYLKEYVGEFLESIRTKMNKISAMHILNQSTYEVKSDSFGTIINKRELSELVFDKNFSWEILSKNKEIENLTIEIYNFIMNR